MAFRNVIIENPAHLSVKNRQLIIKTDREHSLAVEDLSALLLQSNRSTITTAALSLLGQSGCAVFLCDEKHMPCAVLESYCQHSRGVNVIKEQMSATDAFRNRLWKSIVIAKIENQAKCLSLRGKEESAGELLSLAKTVKVGDSENVEAVAAQKYFPALFGSGFVRAADNGYNAALNYGYAIVRGCIARSLAVYGFLPSLGIHHCSELNRFNLADDLIEPFRPLIDLLVSTYISEEDELTPEKKRLLFHSLNLDLLVGKKHYATAYAIELCVQSLSRSFLRRENLLQLPSLTELRQHRYE